MATKSIRPFDPADYPVDNISELKIGLVLSDWNFKIVDRLKKNCIKRLGELGIANSQITTFSVPGSFELPWGVKQLLKKGGLDGIICFGCVIKGETKHDDYINHATTKALMGLNLTAEIPILLGVLTTNSIEQAKARSGGSRGDKGAECAESLVKMLSNKQELHNQKGKIGF